MVSCKFYYFALMAACNKGTFTSVKTEAFATIQETEAVAKERAQRRVMFSFPSDQGWYDHQVSKPAFILKSKILLLAAEYKNENYDTE